MSITSSTNLTLAQTTPFIAASGNLKRKAITIVNLSGGVIYFKFNSIITIESGIVTGIPIAAGGQYTNEIYCPIDNLYLMGTSPLGNATLIMETSFT